MAYALIRPRRGTQYEWSSYNPILREGELGVLFPDTGIGTGLCKFKIGNGVDRWNNLPFAFDGTAAAAINGGGISGGALIQVRSATANAWFNANPILAANEIAYDITNNAIKIGNGVTRWNGLKYITSSSLIDDPDNYDFGTEDSDEPVSASSPISDMEDYINTDTVLPELPEEEPEEQPLGTRSLADSQEEQVSVEPIEDEDNNVYYDEDDEEVMDFDGGGLDK